MLPKEVLQYSNVQFQKISILPHERLLSFRRGQWAGVKASVKLNCNFQREGVFKQKKTFVGGGGGGSVNVFWKNTIYKSCEPFDRSY